MISKHYWKLAGFRERSMPDGSHVIFLCPLFIRRFQSLKPEKGDVRGLSGPTASMPPAKALCLPRDKSAFTRVSEDSA